jgi:hypothetical protein
MSGDENEFEESKEYEEFKDLVRSAAQSFS